MIYLHCIEYTRSDRSPDYRKFQRVFSRGWSRPSGHSSYGRAKYLDQVRFWEYEHSEAGYAYGTRLYDTWLVNLNFSSN